VGQVVNLRPIGNRPFRSDRTDSPAFEFATAEVSCSAVVGVLQLCYHRAMSSTTSSFRIGDELRARFESAASQSGKGKNWILNQALREYLDRMREDSLAAEARRQSLLACGKTTPEERFWAARADDSGWI
jgi:predicted DNA-binding protein